MWKFFKNMVQLVISPDNGWEDVLQSSNPLRARYMMGWMIVLAALSCSISMIYFPHITLLTVVQRAIVTMVVYWATVFIADFVLSWAFPRFGDGVLDERAMSIVISYTVSLLTLQTMLSSLLPMTFAMLELWPVYVVVILWRAMKCLRFGSVVTGRYLVAVIIAFILPSQLLMRAFNYFIL